MATPTTIMAASLNALDPTKLQFRDVALAFRSNLLGEVGPAHAEILPDSPHAVANRFHSRSLWQQPDRRLLTQITEICSFRFHGLENPN